MQCTFAPIFPEASAFIKPFLESTQLLLEGETATDSGLTVASLMILTLGTICYGEPKLAETYMIAGIRMGERMRLIGEQRCELDQFPDQSPEGKSMLKYVAWGAFNVST